MFNPFESINPLEHMCNNRTQWDMTPSVKYDFRFTSAIMFKRISFRLLDGDKFTNPYFLYYQCKLEFRPEEKVLHWVVDVDWRNGGRLWIQHKGILLLKDEKKVALKVIKDRIEKACNYKKLKGITLANSRFVMLSTFPLINLHGMHTDHISPTNLNLQTCLDELGITLSNQLTKATDDRVCNLQVLTPSEHGKKTNKENNGFFSVFNSSIYHRKLPVCKDSLTKLNRNIMSGVVGLQPDDQAMQAELWRLFIQLEFDKYPYGNLTKLRTHT
jgi:hypothetical protein